MRFHLLILAILLFLQSCNSQEKDIPNYEIVAAPPETSKLIKAEVLSVNFYTTTFLAIDCAGFSRQFPDAKRTVINSPPVLDSIHHLIKTLHVDSSLLNSDVRAKVMLHYSNGSMATLCLSNFVMELDGKKVVNDSTLCKLLQLKN